MSALSVAIRRGNVNCVPTFMKRKTEIDFRSTDNNQNTALHHCVLSSIVPKTAFDRLFRCYKVLEWKEIKNVQEKSPLDIAKERWMESHTNNDEKKKEALEHVIDIMGFTVTIENVTDDDDDDDGDFEGDDDDDDDDDNEDVEDGDSGSDSDSDSSSSDSSFLTKWQNYRA
ncbi:PREDICTED: pheromone-processing carboxypeptidase KEX1-like [Acropora digitifera]|uniref:pheromone-processing carboxypeptidase KEX1-like n=1 Tax=Acropora digitifera TaxID=70779 RepID=UPI00077AF991|nr:PREDICTED: pheromone-processing carboxypeptidase KEX1-like [Acropora digitifera]